MLLELRQKNTFVKVAKMKKNLVMEFQNLECVVISITGNVTRIQLLELACVSQPECWQLASPVLCLHMEGHCPCSSLFTRRTPSLLLIHVVSVSNFQEKSRATVKLLLILSPTAKMRRGLGYLPSVSGDPPAGTQSTQHIRISRGETH